MQMELFKGYGGPLQCEFCANGAEASDIEVRGMCTVEGDLLKECHCPGDAYFLVEIVAATVGMVIITDGSRYSYIRGWAWYKDRPYDLDIRNAVVARHNWVELNIATAERVRGSINNFVGDLTIGHKAKCGLKLS